MRFCPFCAQENSDDASECAHCGRRLPPVTASTKLPVKPLPAVRPSPVRAFPRTRPVTPAPALPGSASGLQGAPVAINPEVTPRGKSNTFLGVPTLPRGRMSADEPSTRVESSPFDNDTSANPRIDAIPEAKHEPEHTEPTERFDEESEPTATAPRTPAHRPISEDEIVGDESAPTGIHRELPRPPQSTMPSARKLPVPTRPTPSVAKAAAPPWDVATSRGMPPPAPLPPAPISPMPMIRDEPLEGGTNPANRLPMQGDGPPLPRTGTYEPVEFPFEPTSIAQTPEPAEPAPMPAPPGPGLLPAVGYLLPVARGMWDRHRIQRQLRALLHADQRLVDDALHDLGRVAWQEPNRPAELRAELERADDDDRLRREADQEVARLDMSLATERERFATDEHQRKGDISVREAELVRVTEDLAERKRAQRIEDKVAREVDRRFSSAEKTAQQFFAKATRAQSVPPEKGGGPNAAMNLRQEGEAAQREADSFRPERDAAEARVRALDAPIAELEVRLLDERAALTTARAALETARREHAAAIGELERERAAHEERRGVAERSIRLRLVSTGTILSLHRLDGIKLAPIYGRLDGLQAIAASREQRIARLEAERHSYDRNTLQIGLIVLGGTIGLAVMILVVMLVLLAR